MNFWEILAWILSGLGVTLEVTVFAFAVAAPFAFVFGILEYRSTGLARMLVTGFIEQGQVMPAPAEVARLRPAASTNTVPAPRAASRKAALAPSTPPPTTTTFTRAALPVPPCGHRRGRCSGCRGAWPTGSRTGRAA